MQLDDYILHVGMARALTECGPQIHVGWPFLIENRRLVVSTLLERPGSKCWESVDIYADVPHHMEFAETAVAKYMLKLASQSEARPETLDDLVDAASFNIERYAKRWAR